MQRKLVLMGYGSRRLNLVPLLTTCDRLQRLCWACEHIGWTLDDCKNVAWSNESRFQLLRADVVLSLSDSPFNICFTSAGDPRRTVGKAMEPEASKFDTRFHQKSAATAWCTLII
ncbi:hypothetical protein AVEN_54051-1 [Araneus ventricosus]|uniref:Uncharacterized protein n=1 Tax=Araneus ventricosus TaxID=182803 RepID=A0A4Y2EHI3_ARAVE|nr:hypothetical protein AVEN_54051-1 [Araneus ventricosus]